MATKTKTKPGPRRHRPVAERKAALPENVGGIIPRGSTEKPSSVPALTLADLAMRVDRLERLHRGELMRQRGADEDARMLKEQRERRAAVFNAAIAGWKTFLAENVEACSWEPIVVSAGVGYHYGQAPDLTLNGLGRAIQ